VHLDSPSVIAFWLTRSPPSGSFLVTWRSRRRAVGSAARAELESTFHTAPPGRSGSWGTQRPVRGPESPLLPAGLRWPQRFLRRVSASRLWCCSSQESRMRMAYTRSATRSSVWGRRRRHVRSQAVPRDPSRRTQSGCSADRLETQQRPAGRARDPRQETRDAVQVPRPTVVRGTLRRSRVDVS
jgi:hypothetical protein